MCEVWGSVWRKRDFYAMDGVAGDSSMASKPTPLLGMDASRPSSPVNVHRAVVDPRERLVVPLHYAHPQTHTHPSSMATVSVQYNLPQSISRRQRALLNGIQARTEIDEVQVRALAAVRKNLLPPRVYAETRSPVARPRSATAVAAPATLSERVEKSAQMFPFNKLGMPGRRASGWTQPIARSVGGRHR